MHVNDFRQIVLIFELRYLVRDHIAAVVADSVHLLTLAKRPLGHDRLS